ncbi:WD40 repeat domain-containing protein [Gloeobacter morelensis]|uniref:WD40 repeat domain-containing protein n=1 Tax=Gloeobacter morelensis MG652769 TaxID=2781736 RepID=A0ABY3PHT3_9CYAN|nr:hypothetical protein ISF26_15185 [Gloeobacter morelensis MG652769]
MAATISRGSAGCDALAVHFLGYLSPRQLRFSPDSKLLASASQDKTVRLWNRNGKILRTLTGHQDEVMSVDFSPDGQILASASWDGTVRMWGVQGNLVSILKEHKDGIWSVAFSPDGQRLASAGQDKTLRLWNRLS